MSTIGIKIANGNFYPIIDTSAAGKKRLVLTTVKDGQDSVQVDIYRGENGSIESASYIGSLLLENIAAADKGEPELELIIGIDEENNLTASVGDSVSGEKQSLSLSLDTLSDGGEFDLPDFDLDSSIEPTSPVTSVEEEFEEPFVDEEEFGDEDLFDEDISDFNIDDEFEEPDLDETPFKEPEFDEAPFEETALEEADFEEPEFDESTFEEPPLEESSIEEPSFDEQSYAEEPPPPVAEQRRAHPGLLIIFVILGLIIIGLLAFLIYRSFQGEETPPLFARFGGNRTEEVAEPDPGGAGMPEEEAVGDSGTAAVPDTAETGAVETDAAGTERAEADTAAADSADAAEDGGGTESGGGKPAVVVNEDRLGGVWYWIRWGDTLWDISYSFYRTPWLYSKIAGANNITNPDLIYANTRLFIPEN